MVLELKHADRHKDMTCPFAFISCTSYKESIITEVHCENDTKPRKHTGKNAQLVHGKAFGKLLCSKWLAVRVFWCQVSIFHYAVWQTVRRSLIGGWPTARRLRTAGPYKLRSTRKQSLSTVRPVGPNRTCMICPVVRMSAIDLFKVDLLICYTDVTRKMRN
jgi:hypothetical protein